MRPTWLRLLLLLLLLLQGALTSESAGTSELTNVGQEFFLAFPEIIASYHPDPPTIMAQVTCLHDNTAVTIFTFGTQPHTQTLMMAGQIRNFTLDAWLELGRENRSDKAVRIQSSEDVAVSAISQKNSSVQTVLIVPAHQLGTRYVIPPELHTDDFVDGEFNGVVTERGQFRVVIVNTDQDNVVTTDEQELHLEPYQVVQVWRGSGLRAVEAQSPVAVFFGHPCTFREECVCGQLYVMLPPARGGVFPVPPFLVGDPEIGAQVLVLDGSGATRTYSRVSPVYKESGAVLLYRPGLLLALIPESHFASCYVVHNTLEMSGYAVVVVRRDEADGVRAGAASLPEESWDALEGTDYVASRYELPLGNTIVWHAYSNMAVYFLAANGRSVHGHPAPALSASPDFRGCALVSEGVALQDRSMGWRESVKHCEDQNQTLVYFSSPHHMEQVLKQLKEQTGAEHKDVWIGMRRSALTGDWYWLSGAVITATRWARREPGGVEDGQCAMMSVEDGDDFQWRDESCCKAAAPVCLGRPTLLPLDPPPYPGK